jgi:hypothetical protein
LWLRLRSKEDYVEEGVRREEGGGNKEGVG